jgi:hypothetical protein
MTDRAQLAVEARELSKWCDRQSMDGECGHYWQKQFTRIKRCLDARASGPTWISIEQRKPPEDEPVWLWGATEGLWIGTFSYPDADGWCFTKCYRVPSFIDGKWDSEEAEWDDDYAPTHWMPLPVPPVKDAPR